MEINIITKEDLRVLKEDMINEIRELIQIQPSTPKYLKTKDVKEKLGCGDSKLDKMRKNGTLIYKKIEGVYYYKQEDIDNLFKEAA